MRVATNMFFLLTLLTLAGTSSAWAGQCNITSTPLSFGAYDTLDPAATQSTTSFSVDCKTPPKIAATVTIILSSGNSGNFAQRYMTSSGGAMLFYNLYADASHSKVFGDGSGGSHTATQVVDKFTPWTLTLYGQVPALQLVPAGLYSDTLTATILW